MSERFYLGPGDGRGTKAREQGQCSVCGALIRPDGTAACEPECDTDMADTDPERVLHLAIVRTIERGGSFRY